MAATQAKSTSTTVAQPQDTFGTVPDSTSLTAEPITSNWNDTSTSTLNRRSEGEVYDYMEKITEDWAAVERPSR